MHYLTFVNNIFVMLPLLMFAPIIELFFNAYTTFHQIKLPSVNYKLMSFGFIPQSSKRKLVISEGMQRYGLINSIKFFKCAQMVWRLVYYLGEQFNIVVLGMVVLMWLIGFISIGVAINYLKPYNFQWTFSKEAMKNILSYMSATSITDTGIKI